MNITRALLAVSVGLQVYIIFTWVTLFGVLRRSIWVFAAMGLGLITIYRVTELLSPGLQEYQNVLAFFISLFFAWAAWLTRKQLLAQRRMAEKLREMAHSNDPLEVEPTKLSHQLAEVMNNFHDHIEYYEVKADEHHFPKYEEQMTLNAK